MEPTTSAVASSREMAFTNSVTGCCVVAMSRVSRSGAGGGTTSWPPAGSAQSSGSRSNQSSFTVSTRSSVISSMA
jgi:hypothetical protein